VIVQRVFMPPQGVMESRILRLPGPDETGQTVYRVYDVIEPFPRIDLEIIQIDRNLHDLQIHPVDVLLEFFPECDNFLMQVFPDFFYLLVQVFPDGDDFPVQIVFGPGQIGSDGGYLVVQSIGCFIQIRPCREVVLHFVFLGFVKGDSEDKRYSSQFPGQKQGRIGSSACRFSRQRRVDRPAGDERAGSPAGTAEPGAIKTARLCFFPKNQFDFFPYKPIFIIQCPI
jgi:hypothetical protein